MTRDYRKGKVEISEDTFDGIHGFLLIHYGEEAMTSSMLSRQDLEDLYVLLDEVLETPTVKEDCNECVTTNHGEGCKSDCVCKCHKEEVKEDTKKECTGLPNDPYYCHGVWCGCVEPSVKNLQAKEFALDCARIHPEGKG